MVYLVVQQDKFWSLQNSMTAKLIVSASQKAIRKGLIQVGIVIDSDRGSQSVFNQVSLCAAAKRLSAKSKR